MSRLCSVLEEIIESHRPPDSRADSPELEVHRGIISAQLGQIDSLTDQVSDLRGRMVELERALERGGRRL